MGLSLPSRTSAIAHVSEVATTPAQAVSGSEAGERVRLPTIEALRGIAAVAVVIDHSVALSGASESSGWGWLLGLGTWGVSLFFLLSGYLLADYFWSGDGSHSIGEFYARRFFRIAPAYYFLIAILFLFFATHSLLFSALGLRQVAAQLTFTQWLSPNTSSELNVDGSLWTLTIEMILYVTMPIWAYLISKRPVVFSSLLIALGVGFRVLVSLDGAGLQTWYFGAHSSVPILIERLFIERQFPGILPLFVIGMAAKWATIHFRPLRWVNSPVRRPSLVLVVVLLIPSLFLMHFEAVRASDYTHWIWFTGFDLFECLLILPVLFYASRPSREVLRIPMRAAVAVGVCSYSLYLWHFPVILSVYGMGPSVAPPQLSFLFLRVAAIVILSGTLALVSYRYIERPGLAMGRKIGRRLRERRTSREATGSTTAQLTP